MLESFRRYRVIFPAEHGSWSLTLVPFLIGAGTGGKITPALIACFVAVMGLFFARQPIMILIRSSRGKASEQHTSVAVVWTAILLAAAAMAGLIMLFWGVWEVLWLAIPAAAILGITLVLSTWFGQRQLLIEQVGVVGLALSAPAAFAASVGHLNWLGWVIYGICAVHNLISILYVRYRIDLKHNRADANQGWISATAHLIALAAVSAGVMSGWFGWLVIIPFAGLLIRAVWTAWAKPDLPHVKRFGFTEIGLAVLAAVFIIVGLQVSTD